MADGELLFSYRFLGAEMRDDLQLFGDFEETAYENGLGFSYTRYFDGFMRELAMNYNYSQLGGEDSDAKIMTVNNPSDWRKISVTAGFGDVYSL